MGFRVQKQRIDSLVAVPFLAIPCFLYLPSAFLTDSRLSARVVFISHPCWPVTLRTYNHNSRGRKWRRDKHQLPLFSLLTGPHMFFLYIDSLNYNFPNFWKYRKYFPLFPLVIPRNYFYLIAFFQFHANVIKIFEHQCDENFIITLSTPPLLYY